MSHQPGEPQPGYNNQKPYDFPEKEKKKTYSGLQITVGHRTMADQNLPMSDEIATFFVAIFDYIIYK